MGRDYHLEKNDAYFLFPGIVHYYKTDEKDLLDIWWVGFNGSSVAKFLKEININPNEPIIKNIKNPDLFSIIKDIVNHPNDFYLSDFIKESGNLYKMIGTLMEICSPNVPITPECQYTYSEPVMRAVSFMNSNYPQPISINLVASHAGLSRAYFAITFKAEVGCSPSEYIANLRYQNAKRFLSDTKLSITEVAHSVGFDDALYFSKFFRKFEKMSPSEYRKNLNDNV